MKHLRSLVTIVCFVLSLLLSTFAKTTGIGIGSILGSGPCIRNPFTLVMNISNHQRMMVTSNQKWTSANHFFLGKHLESLFLLVAVLEGQPVYSVLREESMHISVTATPYSVTIKSPLGYIWI